MINAKEDKFVLLSPPPQKKERKKSESLSFEPYFEVDPMQTNLFLKSPFAFAFSPELRGFKVALSLKLKFSLEIFKILFNFSS